MLHILYFGPHVLLTIEQFLPILAMCIDFCKELLCQHLPMMGPTFSAHMLSCQQLQPNMYYRCSCSTASTHHTHQLAFMAFDFESFLMTSFSAILLGQIHQVSISIDKSVWEKHCTCSLLV